MVLHRPVECTAVTGKVKSWYGRFRITRLIGL
jgi:hypothetical protein